MNTETEILRKNVKELQLQLRDAHIRIKDLNATIVELRNRLGSETEYTTGIKDLNATIVELRNRLGSETEYTTADGWAMPVENPDAMHIKEDKDE